MEKSLYEKVILDILNIFIILSILYFVPLYYANYILVTLTCLFCFCMIILLFYLSMIDIHDLKDRSHFLDASKSIDNFDSYLFFKLAFGQGALIYIYYLLSLFVLIKLVLFQQFLSLICLYVVNNLRKICNVKKCKNKN